MLRSWVLAGLCVLLFATLLRADSGVIKTRNGQTFSGDITLLSDQIMVERKGIKITIAREDVLTITYSESVAEEYRRRHERLARYDVRGRIELAQWLFANKSYSLATEVLNEAIQIQPRNPEVQDMMHVVERQSELEARESRKRAPAEFAAADDKPGARAGAAPPTTQPATHRALPLLTATEMNFVRQEEWRAGDRVTVRFVGDVRRNYVAQAREDPASFNSLPTTEQAWEIIKWDQDNNSDRLRRDVILGDPPVIRQFRIVQRSIVAGCANCHAPNKEGGDFILRWPANTDAETYTNFMILRKYNHRLGGKIYDMISRAQAEDSLLIQFALPSAMALPPHPNVQNYNGVVKSADDIRLRSTRDWISSLNSLADYTTIKLGTGLDGGEGPARGK